MKIILKAGDPVRAASWADTAYATVGTIERFFSGNAARINEAIDNGSDLAWAIYAGTVLVGDRAEGARRIARDKAEVARAVTLAAGDEVEIEGRRYTVRFPQKQDAREYPNLSDPIHFVRAE